MASCTQDVLDLAKLGCPRKRVSVLPQAVDVDHFSPIGPADDRTHEHRMVAVARELTPHEGFDDSSARDVERESAFGRAAGDGHVTRVAGLPESAALAGELDLLQLVALIGDSRLVVCGDTDDGHVATATGTPSVLLFGPTAPSRWGPRDRGRRGFSGAAVWDGPAGVCRRWTSGDFVRADFRRQLDSLGVDLGGMCGLAGIAMGAATRGLLDADFEAACEVADDVDRLRCLHNAVERRTLGILAKQAPVAGDLRMVVCAIHIGADADRMGGLASHVARLCLRRHPESAIPAAMLDRFHEMGELAVSLAESCREILTTGDGSQADRVRHQDQLMETLHRELFDEVMGPRWPHGPVVASDVALLGRFYGRFADHADEIARRMVFQTSGEAMTREPAV